MDELRYKLSSQTDLAANMLPPTEDSFYHHVMRCLYQTKLWCNSHIAKPTLPDPDGHGWHKLPDGTLDLKFFEKEVAPVTLQDVTRLYCVDDKCSNDVNYLRFLAGLTCIEACSCIDCPNSLKDDYGIQHAENKRTFSHPIQNWHQFLFFPRMEKIIK